MDGLTWRSLSMTWWTQDYRHGDTDSSTDLTAFYSRLGSLTTEAQDGDHFDVERAAQHTWSIRPIMTANSDSHRAPSPTMHRPQPSRRDSVLSMEMEHNELETMDMSNWMIGPIYGP